MVSAADNRIPTEERSAAPVSGSGRDAVPVVPPVTQSRPRRRILQEGGERHYRRWRPAEAQSLPEEERAPANPIPLISVILPAYNEGLSLGHEIAEVSAVLAEKGVDREIVVVDDGSSDDTRRIMLDLCRNDQRIRYLRLSRNFGKEAAITAALHRARGDAVIVMDADGQHPASLLPTFIEHWRQGCEIVYGVQVRRCEPYFRRIIKRFYYWALRVGSTVEIPTNAGDFRLLDRKVVDAINRLGERNRFMKGLYAWVGFRSVAVPYTPNRRRHGCSRFSLHRLFGLGLTGLTMFSVFPLRLVSVAGLLVSLAALLYGLYLLYEYFAVGGQVAGWPTLAVGMMFLGGVQLMSLGAIGEYLGRVFNEVKQRPIYIVAEEVGGEEAPGGQGPSRPSFPG